MQNPRFIEASVRKARDVYPRAEVIRGDRYHPVLGLRISRHPLPPTVIGREVEVVVPLHRHAGFLPDATIAGVFVGEAIHVDHDGERGNLPFCDPITTEWITGTAQFYPLLDQRPSVIADHRFVCLDSEVVRARTPLEALSLLTTYLESWQGRAEALAEHHGRVVRGLVSGDVEDSQRWLDHLLQETAPRLTAHLRARAEGSGHVIASGTASR